MSLRDFAITVIVPVLLLLALAVGGRSLADEPTTDEGSSEPLFLLPGAEPFAPELETEFLEAIDAKGPGYVPRTRHLQDVGFPRFTNRLILESSPYLQQHAHNPVNWYPWGDEAFETARRLGRPVLLSIGYSTCHWCHVMEEESFEDEEIAAYLNANYIAIKVDREERPDVDSVYMSAVQMLTGRGGWPMTTWLTPDRQVFYGGTYFPPRDGSRGRRTGFLTLLRGLRDRYDSDRESIVEQAAELTRGLGKSLSPPSGTLLPTEKPLRLAAERYASLFDSEHGGMNRAPKFPSSFPNRLLLREYARTGESRWLDMVTLTLQRMAEGGLYDQIGGGFHRYSVDERWLVPHFEKMLYDNAQLAVAYLEAYQVTGDEGFARVAGEVLDYLGREMTSDEGAFYSATDADSLDPHGEREEGRFFTWTQAEIRAILDEATAARVEAFYGVTAAGNFEGRTIPTSARSPAEVAKELGISATELERSVEKGRRRLYEARKSRPAPLLDDKVLTSWNGLAISAFAVGGFVLDRPDLTRAGERAAAFLLDTLLVEGRLRRSFKDGRARHAAYLDDYAFLIRALLDLYETTSGIRWLDAATSLQKVLDAHYRDADSGAYYLTASDAERLLVREQPARDGAEPSGNSVALSNLLRLHELTTDDRYRVSADRLLTAFSHRLDRAPTSLSEMLLGVEFRRDGAKEVVVVLPQDTENTGPLLDVLRTTFAPNKVVAIVHEGEQLRRHAVAVPLVKGKVARDGKPTAYVCRGGVCRRPTQDPGEFEKQLVAPTPTAP